MVLQIPQEMVSQSRNSYIEAELLAPSLDELCKKQPQQDEEEEEEEEESTCSSYLESLIQNLMKETKDKTKGWVTRSNIDNTEISFKKVMIKLFIHSFNHVIWNIYGLNIYLKLFLYYYLYNICLFYSFFLFHLFIKSFFNILFLHSVNVEFGQIMRFLKISMETWFGRCMVTFIDNLSSNPTRVISLPQFPVRFDCPFH